MSSNLAFLIVLLVLYFPGPGAKARIARTRCFNCEEHEDGVGTISQNGAGAAGAQGGECLP